MLDADDGSLFLGAGGAHEGIAVKASVADDNAFAVGVRGNTIKKCLLGFWESVTTFERVKTEGQGPVAVHERRT